MSDESSMSSSEDETSDQPESVNFISGFTMKSSYDSESDAEFESMSLDDPDSVRLNEVMTRLQTRARTLANAVMAPAEYDRIGYISEGDDDLDEYDEEWAANYTDPSNDSLRVLNEVCWRIMDNARRCLASDQKLKTRGTFGVDMHRLHRIIHQISLIDDDLDDFASSSVPVLRELSIIRNLATLIHQLTGKGGESVTGRQVIDEINAGRVLSHYEGFISFREEDLQSLEDYKLQLDTHMSKWEMLFPYFRAYCQQTESLSQTEDRWLDVQMPISELSLWNTSMRDLVMSAGKLLSLSKAVLRHLDQTVRGYRYYRRSLKSNLSDFLNLDISNLFVKELENRAQF